MRASVDGEEPPRATAPTGVAHVSIVQRLRWGFAVGLVVAIVIGAAGLVTVSLVARQVETLVDHQQPLEDAHAAMLQALTDAEAAERGVLISGHAASRQRFERAIDAFTTAAVATRAATSNSSVLELLDAEAAAGQRWIDEFARPVVALYAQDPDAALAWAATDEGRELFQRYRARHETTATALGARGERAADLAASAARSARIVLVVVLVVGGGSMAWLARRTSRATTGPLSRLTDTLDRLRGDRGARAEVEGPSEVRAVAAAVNRLAEENQRFADERAEVVARLQELDQQKSDFVSVVSHELRTPLTSIIGYLEMLEDGDAGALNDDQLALLAVAQRNAGRLLALIEDMLTLSRIESGTLRRQEVPVDLAATVTGVAAELRPRVEGRDLELAVATGPDPIVLGDPEQLERVLFNLLGNALKFTPDGGRVEVRAHRVDDEVHLVVSDSGIGIPADEVDRLFDRFYRASSATTRAIPGTGLGLAITSLLVAQHGGRIEVSSELAVGTTFTVRLPSCDQELAA